jgi:6-phosphogluconolactonase
MQRLCLAHGFSLDHTLKFNIRQGRTQMSSTLHTFDSTAAMQLACAQAIEHQIRLGIAARGYAFLSLAGGSALAIYRQLAKAELDWSQVCIVATDERWVGAADPACNLTQLKRAFAAHPGIRWLDLVPADLSKFSAHSAIKALAAMPMAFDVVLLGMGLDAHTASLFPGSANLSDALNLDAIPHAIAITPAVLPPEAPYPRISLTASRLTRARAVLLAISGAAKRAVLAQALQFDAETLPISRFLHHDAALSHPVQIYWGP